MNIIDTLMTLIMSYFDKKIHYILSNVQNNFFFKKKPMIFINTFKDISIYRVKDVLVI